MQKDKLYGKEACVMVELTAEDLREKTKRDLELARERVRTLEGRLKWIEDAISEGARSTTKDLPPTNNDTETEEQSLLAPVNSSDKNLPGKAIRELMENAPGEFNVPGIVKAVSPQFPDKDYKALSRKASQIANRLAKKKKIKLIHRGEGREPNTYVSTKYTGK